MRRIFLLLCLVAGSANASEHLVWRDDSGIEFVLTAKKPFVCAGMKHMYATDPQGNVQNGCWLKTHDQVHINLLGGNGVVGELVLDATKFQRRVAAIPAGKAPGQPTAEKIQIDVPK